MLIRLIQYLLVLFLSGCGYQHEMQGLQACQGPCQKQFHECTVRCTDDCKQCADRAHALAVKGYNQYKREACVQGGFIARQLQSYHDPLQCRKTTCNCLADYQTCVQACSRNHS